ncbi:hypothetical protein ISN45_Aa05g002790 [Arabidopsis thaliana x Arabidopsis arenosa]|uniref:F-box domain-containing protein n=1 Tax=Arabidopsis thaliana x Arabidopsis arenosa TaxID=1240361 RepID=A0A8T1ZIQ2_9BRAS|nr:hypothetical protein ISN45_Aa05g002790 [Arabidopsis thaliana x Arabidopsis arenosa]
MDTPNDLMREEKGQKVSENHDWSKLCPDLLQNIIERLSFVDFYRAQIVCSDWYTVWKTCVKKTLYPWRILYDDDSLMLFDPREDKKTRKLLGLSDNSYYMASFGNWLLMVDSRLDFYIFNLITCQRIDLPSMETPIHKRINISSWKSFDDGHTVRFKRSNKPEYGEWGHFVEYGKCGQSAKPCRKDHVSKLIYGSQRSAVLWINEKTSDYVVAWIFKQYYLFTYKKGDESWWNWNNNWKPGQGRLNLGYLDLAYENSNLYLYTTDDHIKIIDFSRDFPKEEIENNPYLDHPFNYAPQGLELISKRRIAIQKSGEVLIIVSLLEVLLDEWTPLFYIFKMNLESGKWERVHSIGDDEMLIFGHGVTIRAPVQDVGDGIKNGSICFVKDDVCPGPPGFDCPSNCGVFDLATSEITWPNRVGVKTQWFVPGFV